MYKSKEAVCYDSGMTTKITEVLNERQTTHGDFTENAFISQSLKHVINQHNDHLLDHQREALDMIAHKISRILAGNANFKDHWVDIAGYAQLVADRV